MNKGDLVILKGQRHGRYHLEGGYIMMIEGDFASLMCDNRSFTWPLDDLEPFTKAHVTPRGNEIVAPNV